LSSISAQPAPTPRPEPVTAALGRHTARGFGWMMLQTILSKAAGILGQVAMAWFLSPHDFKLVGLTYAISSFPNLLRDAGLQAILVQRQRHLRRWVGPVFWLSVVLGLGAAALMVAAAPFAARIYEQPALAGLLGVVAVGAFLGSLGTVPNAIVQIKLRFRFQATLELSVALLTVGLNVLLAWRGWGPYSFIVPLSIGNGVRSASLWIASPARVPGKLRLKRWRFVMNDGGVLLVAGLLGMAVSQGDYLTLGLFHRADDTVGIFYFAFNLSLQMVSLITINLGAVLFPALAKLNSDPLRQSQAYLRSARILALIGVPLCFLQAALARPGFHILFKTKWYPAIPVMQVLCLAMAIRTVGITWLSLTAAQGKFRVQLALSAVFCVAFLSSVAMGAWLGGALTVAATEAVFFTLADPLGMYIAMRLSGLRAAGELARVFAVPILAGGGAVGLAWTAGQMLGSFRGADLVRLAVVGGVAVALYVPAVRKLAPAEWKEIMSLRRSPGAAQ
jgi:O-antigen/teichoic acid export membrane protein